MIGQFIALLFLARDLAHREHLRVRGPGSYARHMALGEFYQGVIALADRLAEAYQGRFGIIAEIPLLENEHQGSIIEVLEQQLKWLEANRYEAIPREDSPLQNLVDEVVNQYLSALYKLKNLA